MRGRVTAGARCASMRAMAEPARKLEPETPRTDAAAVAERRAMLLAIPPAAEPPTPEEDAIWQEIDAEVRAGARGYTTEQMLARVEQMRHDAGE